MRKHKFRAVSTQHHNMIFGDLVQNDISTGKHIKAAIKERGCYPHPVDPETVGQYINIQGVEMHEGDTILVHQFLFEGVEVEKEFKGNVVYIEEVACFGVKVTEQMDNSFLEHTGYETLEEMEPFCFSSLHGLHEESFKVIGNIHTTPNLLTDKK